LNASRPEEGTHRSAKRDVFLPKVRRPKKRKSNFLISLEVHLMAKVVYRGVEYDTVLRPQQQLQHQPQRHNETYRGVKFVKEEKQ
jgi:hypothetical protein